MKKAIILVLVGILFCVGTVYSQGVPFTGEITVEDDSKDGGKSVVSLAEGTRDGAPSWLFKGQMNAGIQYPYAVLNFVPDAATKERLRNARTIRFKILGDGNRYRMEYRTSLVTDYGYHAFNFQTTAGQVQEIVIQNRQFQQPGWAVSRSLDARRAEALAIIPDDALRGGPPFELLVWDLRIE